VLFSHISSAPVISQPAVFFSHNKSASATRHQPAERGHNHGVVAATLIVVRAWQENVAIRMVIIGKIRLDWRYDTRQTH
jgi:hypothetical protein